MDEFRTEIRKFAPRTIRELNPNNKQWVAGLIVDVRFGEDPAHNGRVTVR